ncbi:MAG: hypothetical protein PHG53_09570 [Phycisphaerae bacterium]|nr:hypothetical protein [Phycisphaerae bacterium]
MGLFDDLAGSNTSVLEKPQGQFVGMFGDLEEQAETEIVPKSFEIKLPESNWTPQQVAEKAKKIFGESIQLEAPIELVELADNKYASEGFNFSDILSSATMTAYEKPTTEKERVQFHLDYIKGMNDSERSEFIKWTRLGNVFGVFPYLSRKGVLKKIGIEDDAGDIRAASEAQDIYLSQLKLSDPDKWRGIIADTGRTLLEFGLIPGKAETISGTALKFAEQSLLQLPSREMTWGQLAEQKAKEAGKSAIVGAAVGAAGKYIKNPFWGLAEKGVGKYLPGRIPLVTGGFMGLTALEGGTREQIIESGITILGFEAWNMATKGFFPEAARKAKEFNPELNKVADTDLTKVIEQTVAETKVWGSDNKVVTLDEYNQIKARRTTQPIEPAKPPATGVISSQEAKIPAEPAVTTPETIVGQPEVKGQGEIVNIPEPTPLTQPVFDTSKVPISEVSVDKLKLSKDIPNFKESASSVTGEVLGGELQGKYERLGTGPIVVWERASGGLEVITGRHRWRHAIRTGEKTIQAQIVKEADGFTKEMALTIDAESNIREGQGGIKDYAQYFKNTAITEQEARERGLLSRTKGEVGFRIGKGAVDDVYAAFIGGKLNESKAAAIARGAPNNESAQLAAMSEAENMSPEELEQFAKILARTTPSDKLKSTQGNLFGYDDTSIREARAVAREVGKEVKNIKDRILSVRGALRRPDTAREMGLEFSDEETIKKEVSRLEQRLDELKRTSTTPELWNEMRRRAGLITEEVSEKTRQTDLLGRPILEGGATGKQEEFLDKEEYKLPEPDIEGQGRLYGGRQAGSTIIFDPQEWSDMVKIGTFHLEAGARKFEDWSTKMVEDLGKSIELNLPDIWNDINKPKTIPEIKGEVGVQYPQIQGAGELKQRGLSKSTEETAVAKRIELQAERWPGYRVLDTEKQAKKVVDLMNYDLKRAKRIAMGIEEPRISDGVYPEDVYAGIVERATNEGDSETLRDLALTSRLNSVATEIGRRIQALDTGLDKSESPVAAIKDIVVTKEESFKLRTGKEAKVAKKEGVDEIKKSITKESKTRTVKTWEDFIISIQC